MASKWQQGSKYRYITGSLLKREEWFTDLNLTTTSTDAQLVAASAKSVAAIWNTGTGGSVAVLSFSSTGRRTGEPPLIHAHSSQIYDLAFSPFNDDLLVTGGEDSQLKVWKIPEEGLKETISNAETALSGHERRVEALRFHPTSNNLLASGSDDKTIRLWDIEVGTAHQTLSLGAESPLALSWSYDGTQLAVATKEKKLRIYDPRANTVIQQGEGHQGVKPPRITWLGDLQRLATTGFSKTRDRQLAFWDTRNLASPLSMNNIDSSTGVLVPLYDVDSRVLFLAGRGDTTIHYYDITTEKPFYRALGVMTSDVQQRDACMLPKLGVDVFETEVVRIFKATTNVIAPVRFSVPRKSKRDFAADLFPDTLGAPSQTATEWFSGSNKPPVLVSLNPATRGKRPAAVSAASASAARYEPEPAPPPPEPVKVEPTYVPKDVKVVRQSKYKHIIGKGTKKDLCYDNLKLDNSSAFNSSIKTNGTHFAIPWAGSGGRLAVIPLKRTGRLPDNFGLLECKSSILDFDLHPFNHDIVATGTEDAHIRIWKTPADLIQHKQNYTSFSNDLIGHHRKIYTLNFHPTASNVLLSTSYDQTLKLWDIQHGKEHSSIANVFQDLVLSVTFNYDGSLIGTSSNDKSLKIIDPRGSGVVSQVIGHQGTKGVRVCWLGNTNYLFSVGFSKSSEREFKIWDTKNFNEPLLTRTIDVASGLMTPLYDADTGVMFLAGRGDGIISYFELELQNPPQAYFLTNYQSKEPQMDVVLLPKRNCDVKQVEIAHMLKLTTTTVEPLVFKVPRTRLEYFQDDIYVPVPSGQPTVTASEWFSGKSAPPKLVSLQPPGMQLLSQAPAIVREKKYHFDPNKEKEEDAADLKEKVLSKLHGQMMGHKEDEYHNAKMKEVEGVDDSEWDDY